MVKKELRMQTMDILKKLSLKQKGEIEKKLQTQLFASDLWKQAKKIGVTISGGFEWDTRAIIETGWKQGKTIVVPKCYPHEKRLEFYQLQNYEELETVYYNLLEPKPVEENRVQKESIDLIIVPGIVFDQLGYRIGFGGGYYDRFLTTYGGNTVSLLSQKQLIDKVPYESYDIPVKHLLTEAGFLR
ncbi:5-formyltetrahydrofolate cyclo-ligase [Paucisalibacillus globulus]|uniref:5-formyltetrahydrofolate cyclo-ligase n=1 Tax=Paucisalibacillus globulus TaxID=351095 RepID=UPI000421DF87|nr:5-formyltetrahydrofolate cyclo-ligase [Paucisalibacillus globulus]